MEELLKTSEAAVYLGIKYTTMTTYIRKKVLIPYDSAKDKLGRSHLFRKSDLDVLKNNPVWHGDNVQPKRGRSLYINIACRPREDETLENGCTIHWSKVHRCKNHTYVPITCRMCGKKVDRDDMRLRATIKSGDFTGCCQSCAPKVKRITFPSSYPAGGSFVTTDGYRLNLIYLYKEEEQVILKQMRPRNGIYIPEHRAVIALYLGRPLTVDEAVHHINGDKLDNRLENLQLFHSEEHIQNHAAHFLRILDLERANQELLERIQKLESILRTHGISYDEVII